MTRFFQLFNRVPTICFTLITIAHLENSRIWSTANRINPVCDTVECKQLGDLYKNNLNSFGKPCVNFYDYVCHGWGQQFPRPKHEDKWDVALMMQLEVYKEIKQLLEDNKVSNMQDFEEAKAVYKACMSRPHLENATPRVLKNAMNSVAEWPMMYPTNKELPLNISCWVMDELYIKLTGESTLFNFNIIADNFNPKVLSTELKSLESPYGKIFRVSTWNLDGELPNYVEFVKRIIRKLAPPNYKFPEGTFYNDLRDVLNFREALRKIIEETNSEEAVRLPLKMFQTSYAKRTKLNPNAEVDWLLVLRAIYKTPGDPDGLKITERTTVYVQVDYFVKLAELLAATPKKVIVNHIHLYFLERHIEIDSSLKVLLKDSVTVGAMATGKIRDESERWQKCISSNNLEAGLRKMYQKATLSDKKKNAISVLIDEAKRILKDQIDESNWLDVSGKTAAKYKLEKMWKTIGYAGRLSFAVPDCLTANACYLTEKNEIYIANGLMRPPMYVENVPLPVQYGATVTILGHELHHGFDNKGILFDAHGIFSPWPKERQAQFHRQTHCFYNHFLEFRQKYFRKLDICPKRAYTTDTLDEDISDAMGLKLAYKGYKQKLKKTNNTCQALPHFENFTCDQLFFIAHANTACSAYTITAQEDQLLCEDHNIPEIRVNGAVANMKEFNDAFGCKNGDPMNMATGPAKTRSALDVIHLTYGILRSLKMTCFFQSLIRIFVVCVIIITVHFQNWSIWVTADKINPVCNTTECKKLGDMYKKNRNSFGRPCTDFYDYVCHGWGQQFPKPRSVLLWDVIQMMKQNVFLEMKKMLEDRTKSNLRDLEATKALYGACMNAPYLEKSEPWVLRDIINRTTVWPILYRKNYNPLSNMHCWAIDYMYIKEAGESALFDFNFLADEHDNYAIRVELKPLKSPYGMLKQFSDWRQSELSNYKLFLKSIIRKVMSLNQKLPDAIDDDMNTVIQFREELREIIERTESEVDVKISLQNFQNWYDEERKSQIQKSYMKNSQGNAEINWLFMLRAIYKTPQDPDGLRISANTTIFVQKEYFAALADLLANTPRKIIVNHIHLYFLERHIEIDSSLRILLKNSITLGVQPSAAIRYEKERFRTCITNNNVKSPLAELYRKTTLTDKKKANVIAMIDEAKEVLRDEIRESNWMNNRIRKHVSDKINKLRKTIGYTGRTILAGLDSIMPYMCYVAGENQIYVTAAFLNFPIYTPNVPYQIQYGSTLAILGHELYHAFDCLGIMYNGDGHLATFPTEMKEAYLNRTKCFSNLYDKFQEKAFKKLDFSFDTTESADTAEEDFADAMGLKLAYKAYRRKLKENNGTCSVLPGFEDSSCDQMFFIAYANSLCSASSINILERDLIYDVHSGDQLRINAAVANMKEFSEAFACNTNDMLNVQQRCDLWK